MNVKKMSGYRGSEQVTNTSGKTSIHENSGATGGAVGNESVSMNPNLWTVINYWIALPEVVKTGILALVHAANVKSSADD